MCKVSYHLQGYAEKFNRYVMTMCLDRLLLVLGQEEKEIRKDPAAR
jgi:hypothetical protein